MDCDDLRDTLAAACEASDAASCNRRGNLEARAAEALNWYRRGCKQADEVACDLEASAVVLEGFGPDRQPALDRLQSRCKAKQLLACLGLGFELLHGDRAKVDKGARVLEGACNDGQGAACRLFAQTIETTLLQISDKPLTPAQQKLIDRKAVIFDRGCSLGDMDSCAYAARLRDREDERPERCGDAIRWMAESPQQLGG